MPLEILHVPIWQWLLAAGVIFGAAGVLQRVGFLLLVGISLLISAGLSPLLMDGLQHFIVISLAFFFVFLVGQHAFWGLYAKPIDEPTSELIGRTGHISKADPYTRRAFMSVYGKRWEVVTRDGTTLCNGENVLVSAVDGDRLIVRKLHL